MLPGGNMRACAQRRQLRPIRLTTPPGSTQVLGRNLEALITRAQELQKGMKDEFTSVEHLVLAFPEDARFGRELLRGEGLNAKKLEAAVKDIRGSNRVVDQVPALAFGIPASPPQGGGCRRTLQSPQSGSVRQSRMGACPHMRGDLHAAKWPMSCTVGSADALSACALTSPCILPGATSIACGGFRRSRQLIALFRCRDRKASMSLSKHSLIWLRA